MGKAASRLRRASARGDENGNPTDASGTTALVNGETASGGRSKKQKPKKANKKLPPEELEELETKTYCECSTF